MIQEENSKIVPKNWKLYNNKEFNIIDDEIKVGDYFLNDDKIYLCTGFAGNNLGKVGDSMPNNPFLLSKKSKCTYVRKFSKKIIF